MKRIALLFAFAALGSTCVAQRFRVDGAFVRNGVPYTLADQFDCLAIARLDGISTSSDPNFSILQMTLLDRVGGPKERRVSVVWPKGRADESYRPEQGNLFFMIAESPQGGHPVNPLDGDLGATLPRLFSESNELSALLLLRTSKTKLIRDSNRKEMVGENLVPCLATSSPADIFRAAWCLNATGYPEGGCTTNLDGRSMPALGSRMMAELPSMQPAARALTLSILAGWHVNGIEDNYLASLMDAASSNGGLGEYYSFGWRPTTELTYEDLGRIRQGKKPLGPIWTPKIWVDRLAECPDAGAVNIAVHWGKFQVPSDPKMLGPLIKRLESPSVPAGILVYLSIALERRDQMPGLGTETPVSLNQKRLALLSALRAATGGSGTSKG